MVWCHILSIFKIGSAVQSGGSNGFIEFTLQLYINSLESIESAVQFFNLRKVLEMYILMMSAVNNRHHFFWNFKHYLLTKAPLSDA